MYTKQHESRINCYENNVPVHTMGHEKKLKKEYVENKRLGINGAAKRAMAKELLEKGFNKSMITRILHCSIR